MEKMNLEERKDFILNYIVKEYMEDADKEINYDTPLISSGYIDSFSWFHYWFFLKINSKLGSPL